MSEVAQGRAEPRTVGAALAREREHRVQRKGRSIVLEIADIILEEQLLKYCPQLAGTAELYQSLTDYDCLKPTDNRLR